MDQSFDNGMVEQRAPPKPRMKGVGKGAGKKGGAGKRQPITANKPSPDDGGHAHQHLQPSKSYASTSSSSPPLQSAHARSNAGQPDFSDPYGADAYPPEEQPQLQQHNHAHSAPQSHHHHAHAHPSSSSTAPAERGPPEEGQVECHICGRTFNADRI